MSTQPKSQFDKAKNRLTEFLNAFAALKESHHKTTMEKEILPLLKEVFQNKHQKIVPDIEHFLRISMNQENYYSYSFRQALRRLKTSDLQNLKLYAIDVTDRMNEHNRKEVVELNRENNKVHQVNSAIIQELGYRLQEANK